MRFTSQRDYETILKINKEMINELLDTSVVLYKLNSEKSQTNSYGEASVKHWYTGVNVPCRIERQPPSPTQQLQTVDFSQECKFHFLRQELKDREIYPEKGDIVYFDNLYYEIHNTTEVELWAGRVEYKHSIVCEAHLTRKTNLQLDPPQV